MGRLILVEQGEPAAGLKPEPSATLESPRPGSIYRPGDYIESRCVVRLAPGGVMPGRALIRLVEAKGRELNSIEATPHRVRPDGGYEFTGRMRVRETRSPGQTFLEMQFIDQAVATESNPSRNRDCTRVTTSNRVEVKIR